jgi:hypothetical protein
MESLLVMWVWIQANPWTAVAISAYIIANLAPRPHPEDLTGWQRTFWSVIDGLCLLTAARVPGRVKWLLANSPALSSPVPEPAGEPTPEPPDEDDGESEQDSEGEPPDDDEEEDSTEPAESKP